MSEERKWIASDGVMELKPGMLVLVRDEEVDEWCVDIFSHFKKDSDPYRCTSGMWPHCIPLEGNEHMAGTTLPIPQKEKPFEWGEKVLVWDDDGDEKTPAIFIEDRRDAYGVMTKCSTVETLWKHCERAPLDAAAENG